MHQPTTDLVPPLDGTRRTFIKGIAAAGASTAVAAAVEQAGISHLFAANALAAENDPTPFSQFTALAANNADAFEVPPGFRAHVLLKYGDTFSDGSTTWVYGYNNDWSAYYPLDGTDYDEGLLFVNHEYPDPFLLHGHKTTDTAPGSKTDADIYKEMEAVGISVVHIRRDDEGLWDVVSPSSYNRRVFGGDIPGKPDTACTFTGPLAGAPGAVLEAGQDDVRGPRVGVGTTAPGTVGNCSGGTTPWGTALTCEENYDGYGIDYAQPGARDFYYGWQQVAGNEYNAATAAGIDESRRYGWVVEIDPYDPDFVPRKHTALGRFRHENTAFRIKQGKKFVLYMGDDQANQAVYKFVSDRAFIPGDRPNNLQVLEAGTLYVAKWSPHGRRTFSDVMGEAQTSQNTGTGTWEIVEDADLYDTRLRLAGYQTGVSAAGNRRAKQGTTAGDANPNSANYAGRYNRDVAFGGGTVNEWAQFFATNRPEDVEVDEDGSVYIAFTNNTESPSASNGQIATANDPHGALRRLVEVGDDPEGTAFTWEEFAAGGPDFDRPAGARGFSSPDNLTFDKNGDLWVVTDISSSSLNKSNQYTYHGNNALFYVPTSGPNAGVAFRFANMPIEAEGTGPYFTPDEQTLFVNVQHPGEETKFASGAVFGDPSTYTSWWPRGSRTAGGTAYDPLPAMVVISRVQKEDEKPAGGKTVTIPANNGGGNAPAGPPVVPPPGPPRDTARPRFELEEIDSVESLRALLGSSGWTCEITVSEPSRMTLLLQVTLPRRRTRRRGAKSAQAEAAQSRTLTVARLTRQFPRAGKYTVKVRPSAAKRATLRRLTRVSARLTITLRDAAGNTSRQSRRLSFRR